MRALAVVPTLPNTGGAGGDHVARRIERLDIQIAAGGEQRRAEQLEIDLEIERAGVLGHEAIVILIGRSEAMLERRSGRSIRAAR